MKKRLFLFSIPALLLLFLGYGCANDNYLSDREIQQMIDNSLNGQWQIVNITVKRKHWEWVYNPEKEYKGYYSAIVDLPELKDYIFDEGAVLAYYKYDNNSKTTLPYLKKYDFEFTGDDGLVYDDTYSEDISCDFILANPSYVEFIIEASDRERFDEGLQDRDFQIVLIW